MNELSFDDRRHLDQAQGWIELGLHSEAQRELWEITPRFRQHPEFLETQCQIFIHKKRWIDCAVIGKVILAQDAENAMGYILLACALEYLEGIQSAYDTLRPAADRITDSLTIYFNLACYSCELGRLHEAKKWLARTFKEAVDSEYDGFFQRLAVDDLQLEPLWAEIPNIGKNEFVKMFFLNYRE
jgi:predicted Zn-dependent protease